MSVQFHHYECDSSPDLVSDSETHLLEYFRQLKENNSGVLSHPNGFMLTVLLDGDLATVQYSDVESEPPYLMALSPVEIVSDSHVFYIQSSHHTEMAGKFCLSFSVFESIISHFFCTGERISTINWEEV